MAETALLDNDINEKDVEFAWPKALKTLQRDLFSASYDAFIKPLSLYGVVNGEIIVIAPDESTKQTIERRHLKKLSNALSSFCGAEVSVKITLRKDIGKNGAAREYDAERNVFSANLNSKYIFENFVRGKSNELAFAASIAVAESPGQTNYNPLFLYGGVGLGKTHLMHSIGNFILSRDPQSKVLYTSTENLTNDFINSLREHKNQEFRDKYRSVDVLLVDDIQFLSGKVETQEEFFHTFNTLYFANKQIVISSDKPWNELKTMEDRLTSRFGSGLTVDITMPDFETRAAILDKKAEMEKMNVPSEVIRLIAKYVSSNIRELEGALNRVTAYSKLTNVSITVEMAEKTLKAMMSENERREITVDYIQEAVSDYYKVNIDDLRSKKRTAEITQARHVAMFLTHKLLGIALSKIGQRFGGKDHTTVIHACKKMSEEYEVNSKFRADLNEIEKKLKGE